KPLIMQNAQLKTQLENAINTEKNNIRKFKTFISLSDKGKSLKYREQLASSEEKLQKYNSDLERLNNLNIHQTKHTLNIIVILNLFVIPLFLNMIIWIYLFSRRKRQQKETK
ncbi:MAG: hypothetical protein J6Y53_02545, partial [Alphaproteobacteria bacterium]|nr:hypothetical protein [Alphaproteobacteria bacterium]